MRVVLALAALTLSACEQEASFDERYSGEATEIEAHARQLDAELNNGDATTQPLRKESKVRRPTNA